MVSCGRINQQTSCQVVEIKISNENNWKGEWLFGGKVSIARLGTAGGNICLPASCRHDAVFAGLFGFVKRLVGFFQDRLGGITLRKGGNPNADGNGQRRSRVVRL